MYNYPNTILIKIELSQQTDAVPICDPTSISVPNIVASGSLRIRSLFSCSPRIPHVAAPAHELRLRALCRKCRRTVRINSIFETVPAVHR